MLPSLVFVPTAVRNIADKLIKDWSDAAKRAAPSKSRGAATVPSTNGSLKRPRPLDPPTSRGNPTRPLPSPTTTSPNPTTKSSSSGGGASQGSNASGNGTPTGSDAGRRPTALRGVCTRRAQAWPTPAAGCVAGGVCTVAMVMAVRGVAIACRTCVLLCSRWRTGRASGSCRRVHAASRLACHADEFESLTLNPVRCAGVIRWWLLAVGVVS